MDLAAFLVYLVSFLIAASFAEQQIHSQSESPLQQSAHSANSDLVNKHGNDSPCFPELGCFPTTSPWFGVLRPFPGPEEPVKIGTQLYLYTRKQPRVYKVQLWPTINLDGSDYEPNRTTVIITHGFSSNTSNGWMEEMKDAYLHSVDANIFLVDWGRGAKGVSYFQAASNTRVVGAELGRFGKYIVGLGQDPGRIHAIGHSLGAHISGYFGKNMLKEGNTIGRITALDPAQPGFEIEGNEVKVARGDAAILDVLHTDARPFIPYFGFGMLQPTGDVDFYINGGALQPGCYTVEVPPTITSIADIANMTIETISKWISCSHGRSYQYYTWSIKNRDCLFVGRKMSETESIFRISTVGTLRLADPLINSVRSCSKSNCNILGLLTPSIPARGNFAVSTQSEPPFCMAGVGDSRSLLDKFRQNTDDFFKNLHSRRPSIFKKIKEALTKDD